MISGKELRYICHGATGLGLRIWSVSRMGNHFSGVLLRKPDFHPRITSGSGDPYPDLVLFGITHAPHLMTSIMERLRSIVVTIRRVPGSQSLPLVPGRHYKRGHLHRRYEFLGLRSKGSHLFKCTTHLPPGLRSSDWDVIRTSSLCLGLSFLRWL